MKAIKVYTKSQEWQLAKREDGNWFCRNWIMTKYGPQWEKWKPLGQLKEAKICKDPILTEFENSWEYKIKKVYAYFRTAVFVIRNIRKEYKNKLRLPDGEVR